MSRQILPKKFHRAARVAGLYTIYTKKNTYPNVRIEQDRSFDHVVEIPINDIVRVEVVD